MVCITLWINSDNKFFCNSPAELKRQETYRFPWKSNTFSLDCPESEKLSEICSLSVIYSKLTGRRDILNFLFRPIV